MNSEESKQLKQFERRLERRLGLGERWRLRYNCSKPWRRSALHATLYVLLAAAMPMTVYYLLVM